MNRLIISILFTLCVVCKTFTQNPSDEKQIQYGFNASSSITWLLLNNEELVDERRDWAYSFSGNIYYDFRSRLQIHSGLGLHLFNVSSIDYWPEFGCDFIGNGFDPYNSFFRYKVKTAFLSLPFDLKVKLTKATNHLYSVIGLEYRLPITSEGKIFLHECKTNVMELSDNFSFKIKHNLNMKVAFGYECKLDGLRWFVEPYASYGLFPMFEKIDESTLLNLAIANGHSMEAGIIIGTKF